MKNHQTSPVNSVRRTRPVEGFLPPWLKAGTVCLSFLLLLLTCVGVAPRAMAQAYSGTATWTGGGANPFWLTADNWSGSIAPDAGSLIVLTNAGATGLPGTNGSGAVGTPNIIVSNDTRLAALWIDNTNRVSEELPAYHTILISNGVTLTISNNASFTGQNVTNIILVAAQAGFTGQWGVQNGPIDQVTYATIQGEEATLEVICTNGLTGSPYERGNIFISQGSGGISAYPTIDPLNAVLDLSGLGTFRADVNRICVAADPGRTPFFFHRAAGTLYLARTNILTLWAQGNAPSGAAINQGILAGMIAQNNAGGLGRVGRVVLGLTNAIFCDTGIGIGIRNSSGWLGFNPSNPPGISVAYFRDRAGTGRQAMWAVGNRLGVTSNNGGTIQGELDFSGGTIDALVDQLQIGKSASTLQTFGVVSFGAGTLDVNTLQLGYQTSSGNAAAHGTLNVSNTAVLKVNTSEVMGYVAGNPLSGHTYGGLMNITDGGTVRFVNMAPLTCGVGSTTEIRVLRGGKLEVFSMGTITAPLTTLQVSNATLTVDRGVLSNPTVAPVVVENLDAAGVNTVNVLGSVLVVGRFPLIRYGTFVNGGFANFTLGSTSPGITAYLTNNVAASTIDVVVTSSTTAVLTWDGQTNGVNVSEWDIGVTPNWKGGLTYQQSSVPGSLVTFDDTAAGTTTVSLTTDLSPAVVFVTNNAKTYTFTGAGGLVGPGSFTKEGSGLFVLANSGPNQLTGGVVINGGTVQLGGDPDRLPTNSTVTLGNAAGATLDLNGLDQTVGVLAGGGTAGGNVTLGSGNLTIRAGGGTYGGSISGSGVLIKSGSGAQTLTGPSTYSGGTLVSNSSLVVINTSGSGLGSGPVTISTNGLLQLGNGTVNGHFDATIITNNGGWFYVYPAISQVLTKKMVGSGGLAKVIGNETTLYITNANTYTGPSAVQQGVVQISHPNALGSGTITVGNALNTTMLAMSGNITLTNPLVLQAKTGAVVPSPVHINNVLDYNTGLPGTNTITGPITITGSTCWSVGCDGGKLIVTGPFTNSSSAPLGLFFLRGYAEGVWGSALRDASASVRLALDKYDSGTWTLTATNTFTGRTVVNGGKLVVNGALAGTSNVMVLNDATLAGTGYIAGPVTNSGMIDLSGDGVVAPLTISNALFLDSSATAVFDVGNNGNDSIRRLTTVVLDGTLKVVLDGTLSGNAIFKLFDAANYVGGFAGYDLPDISPLSWDTSQLAVDGTLRAVGGPAVTPAITDISHDGSGGFVLSGTGTLVAPYTILATTNVALPLASWDHIGGGTFSNGMFSFTDLTATNWPQRFYRLSTPAP